MGNALATSGRTILYSGAIVALSLTSILVIRAPLFREFTVGALTVVLCTLAAALTLLPAVLAILGERINGGALSRRMLPVDARAPAAQAQGPFAAQAPFTAPAPPVAPAQGWWAKWALMVMRHPIPAAAAAAALLLAAMAPVLGVRYGINRNLSSLTQYPSGSGAQVLARSFSPGVQAPIEVVLIDRARRVGRREVAAAGSLARTLGRDRRVAGVAVQRGAAAMLVTVTPAVAIDSSAAAALVQHIRTDLAPAVRARGGPAVLVGGPPAQSVDISSETLAKLPLVLAITLGLSVLFLMMVFRSVVLPIKAVAMNLLATGATIGLVVIVFQDGHGEQLLGFTSPGFVQTYLPLSLFVLLFGLSMDYEVFLIRRMQEVWKRTGDNRLAVATGVEHTARPITAAAAIMVAVFGSFLTASVLELKEFGFAPAVGILIDATLVRFVLVPALMRLLGARNWWMPARLERVLPRFELD